MAWDAWVAFLNWGRQRLVMLVISLIWVDFRMNKILTDCKVHM